MPPRIDATARRRDIARLAADLVAAHGPDVSLRTLAAEAGASTTVITHYFASKAEVLEAAYRESVRQAAERIEAIPPEGDPRRLVQLCEAVLPLDEARRRNWRTWLAFMGVAMNDARMSDLQRRRVLAHREQVRQAIAAAQSAGQVHPERDAAEDARALVSLVHGIASHAVFDPADWPVARQLAPVHEFCARLAEPPAG